MSNESTVRKLFSKTYEELEALESSLMCKLCNQALKMPVTTSFCDHIFCKECANKYMGKTCPYCMAPMNDDSTQVDHQLSTLVFLTRKLRENLIVADASGQDVQPDASVKDVFSDSAHGGNNSVAEVLETSKNSDPNSSFMQTPRSKKKRNAKGETPLHLAVIKGDYKSAEEMLLEGFDPNVKDNAGWSPLHEACNHGHKEIVQLLLKHGAAVNLTGWENATPLHDAVVNNRYEVVKELLENGAAVGMRDRRGSTPLDLATTQEMKELLLKYQSDANITTNVSVKQESEICIVTTGLDSEQKLMTQNLAELLGGSVVNEVTNQVTHVVAFCSVPRHCPRTLKFLQGVLKGAWILDFRWVESSLQIRSKVPEGEFEVTGAGLQNDSKGPTRARCNAGGQYPLLFDGCHFFFAGNFSSPHPSRDRLSDLVKMGGGVLLNREPRSQSLSDDAITVPYHSPPTSPLSKCTYFVISGEKKFSIKNNQCRASVDWLLDCIGSFRLVQPSDGE